MTSDAADATVHPDELLSVYADGELDTDEAATVEQHVAHCADCAAELSDIEHVRELVRTAPTVAAPEGFVEGLIKRRRRASRHGLILGAAAAIAAVTASVALANPADPKPSETVADKTPVYDVYDEAKIARFNSGRVQGEDKPEDDADEEDPSLADRAAEAASDLLGVLSGD